MELSYLVPKVLRKILLPCAVRNSEIDKTARADVGSVISNSKLGRYSYIGEHTSLLTTEVGDFTSISNYCAIGGGEHPMEWVSLSPVFTDTRGIIKHKFYRHKYVSSKKTYIGNDVWIGSHCLIKSGVKIGDGAVIGMGAVVTKDVGAYEIWVGNPARMIRKRFDDELIKQLLEVKWWDMNDQEIEKYAEYFNSPSELLKNM